MSRPTADLLEAKLRDTMKRELRRSMSATRSVLVREAREQRNSALDARLEAIPEVANARVIAGYVAARGECDPSGTLSIALDRGAIVVLPTVDLARGEILWRRRLPDAELVYGAFGILEPAQDAPIVDEATIDVVLVPGTAFDASGARLGMGKGFYDRALPSMKNALRIGLGFDFQLVAELPVEAHDVPMQLVVTDARTLDFR